MTRVIESRLFDEAPYGSVVAAAGCGKTESIVRLIEAGPRRRTLVLTHTLAGVAALRLRLNRAGIKAERYSLASIDAWCVRRVAAFPRRSGGIPSATDPTVFYPAVRSAALELLEGRALDVALRATYGRVLVDEYQDCGLTQHAIVCALRRVLPTFVFGDPLQAIFNFRDPTVDWASDVVPVFPELQRLEYPWRWERVGAGDLGAWLAEIRQPLEAGRTIDLASAPRAVQWQQLSGRPADTQEIRNAAAFWKRGEGPALVIGYASTPLRQRDLARRSQGVQVVEGLDLDDICEHAEALDSAATPNDRLQAVLSLAKALMTGVNPEEIGSRCRTLQAGRARSPATSDEKLALACLAQDGWKPVRELLIGLSRNPDRRIFRRDALTLACEALAEAQTNRGTTFRQAVGLVRERRRHAGRHVPSRAVGSTLLLKGLEADNVIVVDADTLSGPHLYVALTRATRSLKVFSRVRHVGAN